MVKFNFSRFKHGILKFKHLDIETQYGFRYEYFLKNIINFYFRSWATGPQYTVL